MRTAKLIWLVLLCAGCTPVSRLPALDKKEIEAERHLEQVAQMRSYFAGVHRVENVAFKLRVANRPFCRQRVSPQIGMSAASAQSLPRRFRSFAGEAMRVAWAQPQVISVADGSPAAQAGIREKDEIVGAQRRADSRDRHRHVDGCLAPAQRRSAGERHVAPGRSGCHRERDTGDRLLHSHRLCDRRRSERVHRRQEDRDQFRHRRARQDGCAARLRDRPRDGACLAAAQQQAARQHGARDVAGAAVDGSFLLGTVWTGGVFTREFQKAGLRAYSVAFEREADYVGAYFAARAGYDLTGAEDIWRAMGQTHPDSLRFARTHPLAPARFVQMKRVAEEIAEKQRKHLPLVPDVKEPEIAASDETGTAAAAH